MGDEKRVCIIDDDEDSAESLAILFKAEGFSVERAASGGEALRLVGQQRFDIVICDLSLPDLNGEEVVRRMREQGHPATKYIALSGYDAEGLDKGLFDRTMLKPADSEELLEICREG
jgi:CheY-like chemotaxis protein